MNQNPSRQYKQDVCLMYSSLDKIDFSIQKGPSPVFFQADHRSYEDICLDLEMSIAFALVRVMGPLRMARGRGIMGAQVHYSVNDRVPFALHQAIISAGGMLTMMNFAPIPFRLGLSNMHYLLNNTFSRIAHNMADTWGMSLDLEGIRSFEEGLDTELLRRREREEDEAFYWETVIRLGCMAGEAMKRQCGGWWVPDRVGQSSFPFIFELEEMLLNPFGKARKFIDVGPEDSVAQMVDVAAQRMRGRERPDLSLPNPLPTGPDSQIVGDRLDF